MGEPERKIDPDDLKYTYEEVQEIDDDHRYELYNGELVMLASAGEKHQDVVGSLYSKLRSFLRGKKCKPHISRDVNLFADGSFILIPDVLVLCDRSIDDGKKINGAPDLVVEVLSPSTARRDANEKMRLYKKAGVREYLMIDPKDQTIQQINFCDEKNMAKMKFYHLGDHEEFVSEIFPNFRIALTELFE